QKVRAGLGPPEGYRMGWSRRFEAQQRTLGRVYSRVPPPPLINFGPLLAAFQAVGGTLRIPPNLPIARSASPIARQFSSAYVSTERRHPERLFLAHELHHLCRRRLDRGLGRARSERRGTAGVDPAGTARGTCAA